MKKLIFIIILLGFLAVLITRKSIGSFIGTEAGEFIRTIARSLGLLAYETATKGAEVAGEAFVSTRDTITANVKEAADKHYDRIDAVANAQSPKRVVLAKLFAAAGIPLTNAAGLASDLTDGRAKGIRESKYYATLTSSQKVIADRVYRDWRLS